MMFCDECGEWDESVMECDRHGFLCQKCHDESMTEESKDRCFDRNTYDENGDPY